MLTTTKERTKKRQKGQSRSDERQGEPQSGNSLSLGRVEVEV